MIIVSFIPYFRLLVFGNFDHFSFLILFPLFFRLAHLALQNVNKDSMIFSYCRNFVAKSDQKPKKKNGMNEIYDSTFELLVTFIIIQRQQSHNAKTPMGHNLYLWPWVYSCWPRQPWLWPVRSQSNNWGRLQRLKDNSFIRQFNTESF